jgi:hypothetical protein
MNIHEYQAKEVLRGFDTPVPKGKAAFTVEEAVAAAKELPGPVWVVKAQIHAGGRGKGGGVKVVKSIEDVEKEAKRMLGMTLVTHQTGPHGRVVKRLYIEDGSAIDKEFYLSMLIDRGTSRVAIVVSTEGGMDIEKVAHDTPDRIVTLSIDPASGYEPFHGRKIAAALKLEGDQKVGVELIRKAIEEPCRWIATNAGQEGSIVVSKVKEGKGDEGYNAGTDKYENLVNAGVIDPVKVVRTALQNASSIASLLLTTEALVSEIPEEKKGESAGGPGGPGGMGGMY